MQRWLVSLALLLPFAFQVAIARPANAQDASSYRQPLVHFEDRPVSLEGVAGFGTLVGEVGAILGYTPHRRLSAIAGVGLGLASPYYQVGAGLRLRPLVSERERAAHALALSVDWSMGPYDPNADARVATETYNKGSDSVCDTACQRERNDQGAIPLAHWVQVEVGYQLRGSTGFSLFVGPGVAWLLNPGDCDFHGTPCDVDGDAGVPPRRLLPTLTVSLGYAL